MNSIFIGRFQPLHKGHVEIINSMENPIVVLVSGNKTKDNKKRNPFPVSYQKELFGRLFPHTLLTVSPNGFVPGIIGYLQKQGYQIVSLYCGEDRFESYRQSIQHKYTIEIIKTPRIISSTQIRESIINEDRKTFEYNMPRKLWEEWDTMKTLLTFKDWMSEEETVASDIAIKDVPLFKKKKKNREEKDETSKNNNDNL